MPADSFGDSLELEEILPESFSRKRIEWQFQELWRHTRPMILTKKRETDRNKTFKEEEEKKQSSNSWFFCLFEIELFFNDEVDVTACGFSVAYVN